MRNDIQWVRVVRAGVYRRATQDSQDIHNRVRLLNGEEAAIGIEWKITGDLPPPKGEALLTNGDLQEKYHRSKKWVCALKSAMGAARLGWVRASDVSEFFQMNPGINVQAAAYHERHSWRSSRQRDPGHGVSDKCGSRV